MLLVVFVAVLYFGLVTVNGQDIVTLPDGTKLQGNSDGFVRSFKGVRYAQPPIGILRWAPPAAYIRENVDTVVDATKYGAHCIQSLWPNGSEDCLFLNVFAAENSTDNTSGLPVLVFIHGGSFISGAAKFYPGENLIEYWQGKVILVTLDYRLGVFGFLGSEELRAQDPESKSCGNYGLQDQRFALDWVRRNIGSFGGDPSRVILMGESAGGGSVSNHMTMVKSWDYFSAAIIESGSFSQWITQPMTRAQSVYDTLLEVTSCTDMACLMQLSTEEVYSAHVSTTESSKYLSPYVPTVDGVELVTHPWLSLETPGGVNDVPVLHGTNSDEGILFTALDQRRHVTNMELVDYWKNVMNYSSADTFQLMDLYVNGKEGSYPPTPHESITTTQWWALQRSTGDAMFSCTALHASHHLASQLHGRKSPLYFYHFTYASLMSHYAVHGSEMAYAFHWELGITANVEVADMLSAYWGNFVMDKYHNPNENAVKYNVTSSRDGDDDSTFDLPAWPVYDVNEDNVMVLNVMDSTKVVQGLKTDECAFHIRHIAGQIQDDFK